MDEGLLMLINFKGKIVKIHIAWIPYSNSQKSEWLAALTAYKQSRLIKQEFMLDFNITLGLVLKFKI